MKAQFLRAFDWQPDHYKGRVTVVIQPGVRQVTCECAAKAIAAGAATEWKGDENADSR